MHPFQVYARVRPLSQKQADYFCGKKATAILDNETLAVRDQDYRESLFQLDSIFGEESNNQEIFEEAVRPLADNFLSGINSTVLAYGITGAGKSFTMFGKNNDYTQRPGLIELAIEYICDSLAGDEDVQLSLSYMEIYNEQVFDLLRHKSESLQILDDPVVGVIVNDLEQVSILDTDTALRCISEGNERRVVAQTKANEFSSRSHAIVQLNLEKKVGESVIVAKLSLVDLAGSEKQSVYAQNKGIRNFQGSNINKSLLTLGNCINILSAKKGYVPYRDSKLTRLLKDSLGGNTRTSMIACVSPSLMAIEETVNTMKYACRARKIEKNVHQNVREPRTVEEFKKEIGKLRRELELGKAENGKSAGVSREGMQDMIQRLIKNVEMITTLRLQSSNDLSDKVKEIDLIDQQRAIVNGILSKFDEDGKPEERSIKHSQSQKIFVGKQRYSRDNSLVQINQNNCLQRISEEDLQNLQETGCIIKKESYTLPKNNNFQVAKLENRRLKYRQIRRNLRDLVFSYHQGYDNQQLRLLQVERALLFLQENPVLSAEERQILQRMGGGQRLLESDLLAFHIEQSQPVLHPNNLQCSPQKSGSNRFMSSLQEIRRMMRKINNQSEYMPIFYQNRQDEKGLFDEIRIDPLII